MSIDNRKYLIQLQDPYPHIGAMLRQCIKKKGITKAHLARQLDISPNGVLQYTRNPSIQTAILWKAGVIMQHNFFAELSETFHVKVTPEAHLQELAALQARVTEKDQQIRDLEKELAIYKSIVQAGK